MKEDGLNEITVGLARRAYEVTVKINEEISRADSEWSLVVERGRTYYPSDTAFHRELGKWAEMQNAMERMYSNRREILDYLKKYMPAILEEFEQEEK